MNSSRTSNRFVAVLTWSALALSPLPGGMGAVAADGDRLAFDAGKFAVEEEAPLYERTFQPYGQIFIMRGDGSDKRQLTDSLWEDSMPVYVPSKERNASPR